MAPFHFQCLIQLLGTQVCNVFHSSSLRTLLLLSLFLRSSRLDFKCAKITIIIIIIVSIICSHPRSRIIVIGDIIIIVIVVGQRLPILAYSLKFIMRRVGGKESQSTGD
jgi:hypothetical protein